MTMKVLPLIAVVMVVQSVSAEQAAVASATTTSDGEFLLRGRRRTRQLLSISIPTVDKPVLDRCEGDCDVDTDCFGSLVCFQREKDEYKEVPGCAGGSTDGSRTDYCIDPADLPGGDGGGTGGGGAPQPASPVVSPVIPRSSPSSPNPPPTPPTPPTPGGSGSKNIPLKNYGDPPPADKFPLQECEGDCDNDTDCDIGLYCYQRLNKGDPIPPNCVGSDGSRTDFCASGKETTTTPSPVTTTTTPTSAPVETQTTTTDPPTVSPVDDTTTTTPSPTEFDDDTPSPTELDDVDDPTPSPTLEPVEDTTTTSAPTPEDDTTPRSPTTNDDDPYSSFYVPVNPIPTNPPRGYFNYDPTSKYGPPRWDEVDISDHFLKEFTEDGWGPWEGHLEVKEPLRNRCDKPDRNMSPKNLIKTTTCEAIHEIRTKVREGF